MLKSQTTLLKNTLSRSLSLLLFLGFSMVFFASCSSGRTIVHDLDEKDANEIIVFLDNKGITAEKVQSVDAGAGGGGTKIVTWDIRVPDERATEAIAVLNMYGLPRRKAQNLLNIFSKGGLVPSDMEEKIKYQSGLAEQIASTIRKIDGVLDAEVQLSIPVEDPLNPNEKKQSVTASVYVKHSGVLDDPNSQLIPKIKRLVSSSIPGLDYDNVTVIPDRARFTEIPYKGDTSGIDNKSYVSVWTLIIAKDSVTRFRLIFFAFIILILALLSAVVWVLWKVYPILKQSGGYKELLKMAPLNIQGVKPVPPPTVAKPPVQEEPGEPEEPEQTDKEIDDDVR